MNKKSEGLILENDFIKLVIDSRARLTGLIDKSTGKNYSAKAHPLWEMKINRQVYLPSGILLKGRELAVAFEGVAEAKFLIKNRKDYFSIELISISSDHINEITLADLRVKKLKELAVNLNACYNDEMAFCVMALTPSVHCAPSGYSRGKTAPGNKGISLVAKCYSKYGTINSRAAIIGCPAGKFEKTIEKVESAEGLPCIKLSRVCGKKSEDIKRSYLFIQDLSEQNCDRVIRCAKKMNVGMIMILESWCGAISGHYPVNKKLFPGGIKGLKETVDKIHRAGMKAGLHFLVTGVSSNDAYLAHPPDKRLFKDGVVTLSNNISAKAKNIPSAEYPEGFQRQLHPKGLYYGNSMDIQIDDEIITYGAFSEEEPHHFLKCVRGAHGTKPAPHQAGARIYHLMRSFGLFVTDLDTNILDEIARRISHVLECCGFDMLYFDGSEKLQNDDHWYYNAKAHLAFYNAISPARRNRILYQASSYSHSSWHIVSRAACSDGFVKVKENVNNAMRHYRSWFVNLMPLDIGWYELGGPDVSCSDVEYILCRSIGWGSSCGFQTCLKNLEDNPGTLEMIGRYERLRLSNYFSESVKEKLRKPGAYRLTRNSSGKWVFRTVSEK